MRRVLSLLLAAALLPGAALAADAAKPAVSEGQADSAPTLDYEFFKTRVQPIFTAKRPGRARCIECHTANPLFQLQPLPEGADTWDDAASRKNFEAASAIAVPGNEQSPLLTHPLAQAAGGDFFHSGGKHFQSQNDEEWETLKAWVMGAALNESPGRKIRIIQTNSAGDNVDLIDPVTNTVAGVITGIEVPHGAGASPDGSRIYVTDEAGRSLDVVDAKTLKVIARVGLSGHPNNMAVSQDGKRVYAGIIQAPGGVDVIDTVSLTRVKTIPTKGTIHNVYVTPDGKYVVAGSIASHFVNVIDAATEQPVWSLDMGLGVRPMTMSRNPDGSTKWLFVQLTDFNGFAVVDFATHKEVKRIAHPEIAPEKTVAEGSDPSHGMAVTPDQKILLVNSRLNNMLYEYSLPDLKLLGGAELGGKGAAWVTLTPDGKTAYVANPVTNDVSVVDVATRKEVARIAVGYVPKRNATAVLQ